MSEPTEIDFAIIKISDTQSGTYVTLCGINNVTINRGTQGSDRYSYDCAKPNAPGFRKQRITGKNLDVSGSGRTNADQIPLFETALGVLKYYHVEVYADDGSDLGELLGTYAYASKMTAANMSLNQTGDSTADVTLPSHGGWTYTAATSS